jgi:hypothetical protein
MSRWLATLALATCLTLPAWAGRGVVSIAPPRAARASDQVFVSLHVRYMKVVRLYCDGLYQGRQHPSRPDSDQTQELRFLVSLPQIATTGRWVLRAEGEDVDGVEITPVENFVAPERDRDVQTQLEVDAPASARAPDSSLYARDTSVTAPAGARHTLTIAPAASVVEPGQRVPLTISVFERGTRIPDASALLEADAGAFSGTTWIAPDRPGRYRLLARYEDGVVSARMDVGDPLRLRVISWGLHQLRLRGARFASGAVFVDPNVRPTTTVIALLLPEDRGKTLDITVEGLDLDGHVLKADVVSVAIR